MVEKTRLADKIIKERNWQLSAAYVQGGNEEVGGQRENSVKIFDIEGKDYNYT